MFLLEDQRRNQAQDVVADSRRQHVFVEAFMLQVDAVDLVVKFKPQEAALAAGFLQMRQFFPGLFQEVCPHLLGIASQVFVQQFVDFGQGCGAADRMAAEGTAVGTHGEGFGNIFAGADSSDWHAAAQGFGHRDDIRFDAVVHVGHDSPGAAPAALYFIEEEEQAFFIAQFAQAREKFFCCRMDTAFALYRFDHDADGVFRNGIFKGFQIVKFSIFEARRHGAETDLAGIVRLARSAHGTKGTAVEGFFCRDDFVFVGTKVFNAVFTGHLDHGFVGFCPRVLEEDLVHADGRANLFSQQGLRYCVRIVEGLHDVHALVDDGQDDFVVAAAGAVDGDTSVEIKVLCPVFIVDVHAFAAFCNHVEAFVRFNHVLVYFGFDFFFGQSYIA